MEFTCQNALPLVPSYLDGELSEARAGLLRKHLLDCASCRNSVQDSKVLSRWFATEKRLEFAPPTGFAARVARRAFAGDAGSEPELVPQAPRESGRLLQFVLTLTAVAAAIMLVSAIALHDQRLPEADQLDAAQPPVSLESVKLQLDELNRLEQQPATKPTPASGR
jgi:anti-sigma factor RsiW